MNISTNDLSILINIGTILFFAGAWWQNSKHNKETIEELKKAAKNNNAAFENSIKNIKDDFQNKLSSMKTSFDETLNHIKEFYNEKIADLKENIKDNIAENTRHTTEQIKRLEEKQDKHNGLYDKVIANEQSVKSAHHRIDELTGRRQL